MAPLTVEQSIGGVDDIEPSEPSDVKELLLFSVATDKFVCEKKVFNASKVARWLAGAPALG